MPEKPQAEEKQVEFLIVGMARSGTTLIQRLASELQGVWVPPETHFWRHAALLANKFPPPLDRSQAVEAISWFSTLDSSKNLVLDPEEVGQRLTDESYLWDLFDALVSSISPEHASVIGEKTPDHLRWCEQLLNAVDHLKVIGLVREPREVFRSHQSVPWGIRDPHPFAEKWVQLSRALRDCEALFPGRVLALRYEDVAIDPANSVSVIAEFLGVPNERDPDFDRHKTQLFPDSEWWKAGSLAPISSPISHWREEVAEEHAVAIAHRARGEMIAWGYNEISEANPRPAPLDSVMEVRRSGEAAALHPLPTTAARVDAWRQSAVTQARKWKDRAQELQRDLAAETKIRQAMEGWKAQSEHLRTLNEQIVELNRALTDDITRLRSDEEKSRRSMEDLRYELEELRSQHKLQLHQEMLLRLKSERKYWVTAGKLRRLRARRWWKLAGALSRWRRRPWGLLALARDLWRTTFGPNVLPAPPDVSRLDERIAALHRAIDEQRAIPGIRGRAREAILAGDYEEALSILETAPDRLRNSKEAKLLARDCYIRLGEVTEALIEVRSALRHGPDRELERQARMLEGRLKETDPNWLPPLPASRSATTPIRSDTVLHILKESLPFFERGYTIRSHTTLKAQQLAGFQPVVVTSLGFPREQGFDEFSPVEMVDGMPHHRLDLGNEYRLGEIPYDQVLTDQAMLTVRLAEEVSPRLLQAGSGYRGYETALVALAVGRALDIPAIYEIRSFLEHTWTAELDRSESGEYYRRRFEQESRCLRDADFVVTIAEAMRDELVNRGIDPERIAVVPNVVDVDRFQPRAKRNDLAETYQIRDRFVLGYISNLGQREGIGNLIQAVGFLRAEGAEVAGLIVGEGPEQERLREMVTELNLEKDIVMTGHVPNRDIEDHYALIDLFVVPRIDDRAARLVTPLKPLEAMAMGIPVIAADLPALRELVAPGERGITFRPGDPRDLADVVSALIADAQSRHRFASAAREWVLADRTVEANALRYRQILERVLGVSS